MLLTRGARAAALPLLAAAALLVGLGALSSRRHLAHAKTLERDVYALIALHQEVKDRDPEWRGAMDKWPVHTCSANGTCAIDPCGFEWEGDGWEGISCRYQWNWDKSIPRVVTNFHLPKRGLSGALPRSLALFANITEIDMDANRLVGTLPPEWGCLRQLIEIDLSKNQLQGSIPAEWGVLRGLIELELDGNAGLSGCVPEGLPDFNRWCGGLFGPPCPGFTNDPLIGTDISGTRIRGGGRCAPYPGGDAALAARLRCPGVGDSPFRESIQRFFAARRAAAVAAAAAGRGSGGAAAGGADGGGGGADGGVVGAAAADDVGPSKK